MEILKNLFKANKHNTENITDEINKINDEIKPLKKILLFNGEIGTNKYYKDKCHNCGAIDQFRVTSDQYDGTMFYTVFCSKCGEYKRVCK